MAKAKGQDAKRRRTFMKDQHGRKYFANIEIETGDPLDLAPHGWTAPRNPAWAKKLFIPPIGDPEVVRVVPDDQRADTGCDVFIDYAKWEEKILARNAQRTEQLRAIVQTMQGVGDVVATLQNPPRELLLYVGPEAFPPVEIIRSMRAGNEWALGFSDVVPEKAEALLERIRPQVMEARMGRAGVVSEDEVDDPFADELAAARDAALDRLMDIEEDADPLGVGGHVVPVKKVGRPRKLAA